MSTLAAALLALVSVGTRPAPNIARLGGAAYVEQVAAYVQQSADLTGVPVDVLAALLVAESSLDQHAVSSRGAVGLAQLFGRARKDWQAVCNLAPADCAANNVLIGARVLARAYERCGYWGGAISVYRGRGKCVDDAYSRHVMKLAARIREVFNG